MKLRVSKNSYVSPDSDRSYEKACQNNFYRNGTALQGHARDAHGGEVVSDCLACQEILRKMAIIPPKKQE